MSGRVRGRLLYVDPWSGVAGDMLMAALLEVGDALGRTDLPDLLAERVDSLGLPGVRVVRERGREGGFACSRIRVVVDAEQPERHPEQAIAVVEAAGLPDSVREGSVAALERLATVEAGLHGVPVAAVHLHELGAVDTIVDVVGVFSLLDALEVDEVAAAPLPLGSGTITIDHGRVGVPAPATLELLRGAPVAGGEGVGELTTPTGALLVTQLAGSWGPLPAMTVEAAGFGAGQRSLEGRPNLLRLIVGNRTAEEDSGPGAGRLEEIAVLTTTVDDVTGETMGYVIGRLLDAGAYDAHWAPVVMKKSRPGAELTVICAVEREEALVEVVFCETGTFGIRRESVRRYALDREFDAVEVAGMRIGVKLGYRDGRRLVIAPEYEDCRAAAEASGRPLREVMGEAVRAARERLEGPPEGS